MHGVGRFEIRDNLRQSWQKLLWTARASNKTICIFTEFISLKKFSPSYPQFNVGKSSKHTFKI